MLTSTRRVAAGRTNARGATVRVPHAPRWRSARQPSRLHQRIRPGEKGHVERARFLPGGTRSVDGSGDGLVKILGGDSIADRSPSAMATRTTARRRRADPLPRSQLPARMKRASRRGAHPTCPTDANDDPTMRDSSVLAADALNDGR
jgi:hypothetical protein